MAPWTGVEMEEKNLLELCGHFTAADADTERWGWGTWALALRWKKALCSESQTGRTDGNTWKGPQQRDGRASGLQRSGFQLQHPKAMITQRPTAKMTVEPTSGPELTHVLLYAPEKKAKGTRETEET